MFGQEERETVMRSDRHKKAKNKKTTAIIVVAVLVVVLIGVGVFAATHRGDKPTPVTKKVTKDAAGEVNPLTGETVKAGSLPSRPIVVSIDNDVPDARPQSGLSSADIVYEVPMEGGASRYEPIFLSQHPKQAGPTRSVRPYIVDVAREYNAVLVHNGYSPQAKAYLAENVVPYYPAQKYDHELFWRTSDRYIPHNQYTSVKKDWEKIKKDGNDKKQKIRTFKWLQEGDKAKGEAATEVEVNYPVTGNTYKYDSEKQIYKRYVNGDACVDLSNDNKQITCSNILVQKVSSGMYDAERLQIDMTQGGEAWLFTKGKVIKGTWARKKLDSKTVFKDKDGKEFKLIPGKTWIQLINGQGVVKYKEAAK